RPPRGMRRTGSTQTPCRMMTFIVAPGSHPPKFCYGHDSWISKGHEAHRPDPLGWSDRRLRGHDGVLEPPGVEPAPARGRLGSLLRGRSGGGSPVGVSRLGPGASRSAAPALGSASGAVEARAAAGGLRALRRAASLRTLHARARLGSGRLDYDSPLAGIRPRE